MVRDGAFAPPHHEGPGEISRQPPPTPQPEVFLRLQLRDREQIAQMIEPVAPGKPREVSERLGDEACGFVRTALARRLTRRRTPLPWRRFLLPFAPGPTQQRQN